MGATHVWSKEIVFLSNPDQQWQEESNKTPPGMLSKFHQSHNSFLSFDRGFIFSILLRFAIGSTCSLGAQRNQEAPRCEHPNNCNIKVVGVPKLASTGLRNTRQHCWCLHTQQKQTWDRCNPLLESQLQSQDSRLKTNTGPGFPKDAHLSCTVLISISTPLDDLTKETSALNRCANSPSPWHSEEGGGHDTGL
eukprot:6481769-Amphidinium_carterae.1